MPADVLRLFVFARHAESVANAANMLNSNPSQPVALTARGRNAGARPRRATRQPLRRSRGRHAPAPGPADYRHRPGRPGGANADRTRL